MINLLPKAYKVNIRAARTNVILIRYIWIIFFAFIFLLLILAGSIFLLNITRQSSNQLIEINATEAAQYSDTSREITRLTSSLNDSKEVFNQQISYSKVLRSLAEAMPAGTVINELAINDESINKPVPVTLTVYATSNEVATQLGQSLQSTPGFSGVKIDSVSDTAGIPGYPVSANVTVVLNRSLGQ